MNEHFKLTIELTARDADDVEMMLMRRVRHVQHLIETVRRKRSWAPSVVAATIADYELERRTLSALAHNISRAYAIAKRESKQ